MHAAKVDYLECLNPVRHGGALWSLITTRKLAAVTPAYLNGFEDYPLRRHDRIVATASTNESEAEYATLVISALDDRGKIKTLIALP